MTKKATSKSLAMVDPSTLTIAQVPALLEQVELKISDIKGDNSCAIDVGSTSYPGVGSLDGMTLEQLISVRASVNARASAFDKEKKAMIKAGVPVSSKVVFLEAGFTAEQWISSIDKQYRMTSQKDILEKLSATKEKLKKYITKEQQLASDMKDIVDILS